jgi:hypothetical protein
MSNVTFYHVDYTNTTFFRLRLKRTTLANMHFQSDLWRESFLQDMLIGKDTFILKPGTERDYGVRAPAKSSKGKGRVVSDPLSPDDLKQKVSHGTVWQRDIRVLQDQGPQGRILARLACHENIMDRIMQYCFPGSNIHIHEYPFGFEKPTAPARYQKRCSATSNGIRYPLMLFGSLQPNAPTTSNPSAVNLPHRGVGNCTCLLSVNKKFYAIASKRLYNRTFHLHCSPDRAREFLRAHPVRMKMIKQLVL